MPNAIFPVLNSEELTLYDTVMYCKNPERTVTVRGYEIVVLGSIRALLFRFKLFISTAVKCLTTRLYIIQVHNSGKTVAARSLKKLHVVPFVRYLIIYSF